MPLHILICLFVQTLQSLDLVESGVQAPVFEEKFVEISVLFDFYEVDEEIPDIRLFDFEEGLDGQIEGALRQVVA